MINLLTQWPEQHAATKPGGPGKEPFNESHYARRLCFPGPRKTRRREGRPSWSTRLGEKSRGRAGRTAFHLLVFLDFLLGADGAVLLPLLIGRPEIVLGHPAMENPNAVHTHKEHGVRHQLRGGCKSKAFRLLPYSKNLFQALLLILNTFIC